MNEGRGLGDAAGALRRRWRLVVVVAVAAAVAALAVSLTSRKQYDASANLLLTESSSTNPVLATSNTSVAPTTEDPQRMVYNAVGTIKQHSIAQSVIASLKLHMTVRALLDEVSTSADAANSDLVTITVQDRSPKRAAAIANAFAQLYISFRVALASQSFNEGANLALAQFHGLPPAQRSSAVGQQLLSRAQELQVDAALQTGGVQLVDAAQVPTSPSSPKPTLDGGIGLLVGLLLGIAVAIGLELVDHRLREETEIERAYGLPILATVPRLTRRELSEADKHQREPYGMLAAVMNRVALDSDKRVVLVTSAIPGEGKTSVALGLARALARLGVMAVAVEADLRRPTFCEVLGLERRWGLSEVLAGAASPGEATIWLNADTSTRVSEHDAGPDGGFGVLPAGRPAGDPQLVLSRPTMDDVINYYRARVDVIVVDAPPMGTVSDAAALARLVDQAIIVGRINTSTRDAVRRLRRVLENSSLDPVGLVVMGTERPSRRYGYGYYGAEPSEEQATGNGAVVSRDLAGEQR